MTTVLLVLIAVLVVLGLVAVVSQMMSCPLMWCFHLCCGTVDTLLTVLGGLLSAIFDSRD